MVCARRLGSFPSVPIDDAGGAWVYWPPQLVLVGATNEVGEITWRRQLKSQTGSRSMVTPTLFFPSDVYDTLPLLYQKLLKYNMRYG